MVLLLQGGGDEDGAVQRGVVDVGLIVILGFIVTIIVGVTLKLGRLEGIDDVLSDGTNDADGTAVALGTNDVAVVVLSAMVSSTFFVSWADRYCCCSSCS